jgi:hypothetical protein
MAWRTRGTRTRFGVVGVAEVCRLSSAGVDVTAGTILDGGRFTLGMMAALFGLSSHGGTFVQSSQRNRHNR